MSPADGLFDARWEGKSIRKAHWHFHAQLYRRYRIILGPGDFSEMLRAVRTGSAQMVHKPSAKKAIYAIRLPHIWKRFFVLAVNGHVVTALPETPELRRWERITSIDYVPGFWFVIEESDRRILHAHGEIGISDDPALLKDARKAFRLVCGEWETTRQHQAHTHPEPDVWWSNYVSKDAWKMKPLAAESCPAGTPDQRQLVCRYRRPQIPRRQIL